MTIPATDENRTENVGNGVTVAFSFPHLFFADVDLVVLLVEITTGTVTTQLLTTNYTVTGAGNPAGGPVTFIIAPPATHNVVIFRDPALTQGADLVENDPLPVETAVEQPLDRLTMIAQRTRELGERSLQLPDGDTGFVAGDMQIPPLAVRKSKFSAWGADGKPIASTAPAGGVPVSTFMETVVDDVDDVAARTTLGAADDTAVVHLAGVETITGAKTFTADQTLSGASLIEANASVTANATTSDIWTGGNYVTLTGGVVTFTDFADAPQAGAEAEIFCNAAHVFTDNANLEVDGDANFTAEAGDRVLVRAKSTTVFTLHPIKKTGLSVSSFLLTNQATTSGTQFDFTTPRSPTEVDVILSAVSLSGTEDLLIQIGPIGGVENTAYSATGNILDSVGGSAASNSSVGFIIRSANAGNNISGIYSLRLIDPATNTWSGGFNGKASGTDVCICGGEKAIAGVLRTIRVTRTGADTFDAGSVNVRGS